MSDLAPLGFQFSTPQASGDRFVMAGYDDNANGCCEPESIYTGLTDGSSPPRKISVNKAKTFNNELPDISGRGIVWSHLVASDRGGFDFDLIYRKLGDPARDLVDARGFQWFPSIDGDRVVWEDTRSGDTNIWTMTLDGEPERLTNVRGEQLNPQVSGDWVVWIDYGNFDRTPRIQMKNVKTGELRTITPKDGSIISSPSVNSTHVYWYEDSNGDGVGEIKFARLGSSGSGRSTPATRLRPGTARPARPPRLRRSTMTSSSTATSRTTSASTRWERTSRRARSVAICGSFRPTVPRTPSRSPKDEGTRPMRRSATAAACCGWTPPAARPT